jgi:hypothetical protein
MIARLQRTVLQLVVLCLAVAAPLAPVQAGIVGTDTAMAMAERAEAVARINDVLMRDDVQSQLQALGVDPQNAMDRVAGLTNAELAQLQSSLNELPAGGDVLAVLGVVLVVLLVLELLGVTNVFTGL